MRRPTKLRWLLLLLCLMALLDSCRGGKDQPSSPSGVVEIDAQLKYEDATGPRPIIASHVEVWRFAPRPSGIWGWSNDGQGQTDGQGRYSQRFAFDRPGIRYALRVFPWNRAAQCCFASPVNHQSQFFVEPGQPGRPVPTGKPIQKVAQHAGETLTWNYTWPEGWWAQAFNIVETLRHGRAFAEQLRDPEESKRQPLHTAHIARGGCAHLAGGSCMYPVTGEIFIAPNTEWDDYGILHEYGHYLQYEIGSLAWIASIDEAGCMPKDVTVIGGGSLPSDFREKLAWLEGFADWFALAMWKHAQITAHFYLPLSPDKNLPITSGFPKNAGPWDDTSLCDSSDLGDMFELHVANMLWDLVDLYNADEEKDLAQEQERMILQIMDQELGTPNTRDWPRSLDFYWVARNRRFNDKIEAERVLFDIYNINRLLTPYN